ncbi:MAG: replicative DNA helicase, partial [Chlorobi bacterium]|nr:replicative DNA helicase [Chlorobiota bacterium]
MPIEKNKFEKNNVFPLNAGAWGNKVPPHSNEAEIAVIGAMMLDRSAVAGVVDILTSDSFYSEIHRVIFDTMVSMFNLAIPVDIITLS